MNITGDKKVIVIKVRVIDKSEVYKMAKVVL